MTPVLCARGLTRVYPATAPGGVPLTLFRALDLELFAGELMAVTGRSGSGKSSLLHLLAGLDRPDAGSIHVGGVELTGMTADAAAGLRNRAIGFVWQTHYLLPEFTAAENVAMPLLARNLPRAEALQVAARWLEQVGLAGRTQNRSGELSGGEQQRVSIARALVTGPPLLLADEPTGDLDDETADALYALLRDLQRRHRLAILLVTHNLELARRADRRLQLRNGAVLPA